MILTDKAKEAINKPAIRRVLMDMLDGVTEQTVIRCIKRNRLNSPLTTVAVVAKIKELTGLTESEILEGEAIKA